MTELVSLSEEARLAALDRSEFLRPHLEGGHSLSSIACAAGVPYRTAHRWLRLYREHGLTGLARLTRQDKGKERKISSRLAQFIEGLALRSPPIPIATIHRMVGETARQIQEPVPSYISIYRFVNRLPDDLKTLAQQGSKAYSDAFELVHRREAERPNAIWQADHCLLDVLVKRPDDQETKPWLFIIIDDCSRAVAGFFLAFEDPCALRTALTLRQAIWRKDDPRWHICGIPDALLHRPR